MLWPALGYRRVRRWPAGWRCAAWRWAWVWRGRRTPAPAVTPCCTRPDWHHGACAAASGSTSASAPLECPVLQSNTHNPAPVQSDWRPLLQTIKTTHMTIAHTLNHFTNLVANSGRKISGGWGNTINIQWTWLHDILKKIYYLNDTKITLIISTIK